MTPTCPKGYDCTFLAKDPVHLGPWWEGTWGIVLAILALIGLVAIVCTVSYHAWQRHQATLRHRAQERQRAHELAIEEQRTMQLDAAKGDADALRIVREMQRR